MDIQFETYASRVVSEEEYVFWHQALNRRSEVTHYNWSRAPREAKQLADRVASSYDELWVEYDWKTGNDPALFGKKSGQIYLLARWGTDEVPLRTEGQLMTLYRRQVEREAARDNGMLQGWWFVFEALFAIGGISFLTRSDLVYGGAVLLALTLLLEVGRRCHKKRGLNRPINVWEQRALDFLKQRHAA